MTRRYRDLPDGDLSAFAISVLLACVGAGWLLTRIMLNEPTGTWLVPAMFTVWWVLSAHKDWHHFVEHQRLREQVARGKPEQS